MKWFDPNPGQLYIMTMTSTDFTLIRDLEDASRRLPKLYGVHFPEESGAGYLLISYLDDTFTGQLSTVLSLADNKILVRKHETHLAGRNGHQIQSLELHEYNTSSPTLNHNVKTTTTWSFCNGGTILNLLVTLGSTGIRNLASISTSGVLPEAFIYKTFDTMLSILDTIHSEGVTHGGLGVCDVLLHWPTPGSRLPEVFLSDFSESDSYPWKLHPSPELKTPFKIASLGDAQIFQVQGQEREQNSDSLENSNVLRLGPPTADKFSEEELRYWYDGCRQDYEDVFVLIIDLMTMDPFARVRRGEIVNGFSAELCTSIAQFKDIIDQFSRDFRPSVFMDRIRQFHAQVKAAALTAQAAFDRGSARSFTLLDAARPPMPGLKPAMWTSRASIARIDPAPVGSGLPDGATLSHEDWSRSINLDVDKFEIRSLIFQVPGFNWTVDPEDYNGDDRDSTEYHDVHDRHENNANINGNQAGPSHQADENHIGFSSDGNDDRNEARAVQVNSPPRDLYGSHLQTDDDDDDGQPTIHDDIFHALMQSSPLIDILDPSSSNTTSDIFYDAPERVDDNQIEQGLLSALDNLVRDLAKLAKSLRECLAQKVNNGRLR